MTGYLYSTDFTVPASTPIGSPFAQFVTLDDRKLASVRFVIPDGHNGLTGVRVTSGGTNVVPYVQGTWLVGNNEIIDFNYDGEVQVNRFRLVGYNTDIFAHTFHLRWTLVDLDAPTPVSIDSPQAVPLQPAAVSATITGLTGALDQAAIDQMTAAAGQTLDVSQLAGAVP